VLTYSPLPSCEDSALSILGRPAAKNQALLNGGDLEDALGVAMEKLGAIVG
jgi:hypothetical protein